MMELGWFYIVKTDRRNWGRLNISVLISWWMKMPIIKNQASDWQVNHFVWDNIQRRLNIMELGVAGTCFMCLLMSPKRPEFIVNGKNSRKRIVCLEWLPRWLKRVLISDMWRWWMVMEVPVLFCCPMEFFIRSLGPVKCINREAGWPGMWRLPWHLKLLTMLCCMMRPDIVLHSIIIKVTDWAWRNMILCTLMRARKIVIWFNLFRFEMVMLRVRIPTS